MKEWWILEGVDHPIVNSGEHKQELVIRTITFLETT